MKCVSLQMNCDQIIPTFDSVSDTLTNLWQCATESVPTFFFSFFFSWQESKLRTKRVIRLCQNGPAPFIEPEPLILQRPFWHMLITLSMQSFKFCNEEGGILSPGKQYQTDI